MEIDCKEKRRWKMGFYDNRGVQMVVAILFCLLWKNTLYVIISNVLMWIVSVPMWWLLVERVKTGQGAETFISSLPFIILLYIFTVLLPEILIVLFRHYIFNKFRRRNSK
ncbi:hypothetical protein ABE82_25465 [Paenibacillus peoriae]|nr:hypothetical protein ABE82_25465 [Paenibacillus peoriae]